LRDSAHAAHASPDKPRRRSGTGTGRANTAADRADPGDDGAPSVPNIALVGAQASVNVAETYSRAPGWMALVGVTPVFPLVALMQMMSAGRWAGISLAGRRQLGAPAIRCGRVAWHAVLIAMVPRRRLHHRGAGSRPATISGARGRNATLSNALEY
jgi:hypothetical protein